MSRNHFPYSSKRSNTSSVQVLSWDCSNPLTSSGSTSNSSFLAFSTTLAVTSSTDILESLKVIHESWNPRLRNWSDINISTSSHESWEFLMEPRRVNPFPKVFNLLCPGQSEEMLSMAVIALWIVFLNNKTWESKLLPAEWMLCSQAWTQQWSNCTPPSELLAV